MHVKEKRFRLLPPLSAIVGLLWSRKPAANHGLHLGETSPMRAQAPTYKIVAGGAFSEIDRQFEGAFQSCAP